MEHGDVPVEDCAMFGLQSGEIRADSICRLCLQEAKQGTLRF